MSMSDITVSIPFEDRKLWIKRIDKRIGDLDREAVKLYESHLHAFYDQHWFVRFFFGPPTLDMAKRQALNGVGSLKTLKEMLEMPGWITITIDGWVFKLLSSVDV